jgi:hypothetical protein
MTIEFFTGFEGCTSTGDVQAFFDYSLDVNYYSTGGFENSKALRTYSTGSFQKIVSTAKTKAVGFHCKATEANNAYTLMGFMLADGGEITIRNATTGCTVLYNSTIVASCSEYFSTNMHHFECEVFSNATAGYAIVKKDNVEIINATGLNTGGSDIIKIERRWSTAYQYMDNLYIADSLQGELYSFLMVPREDTSVQFTPSEGTTNYTLLETNDGDSTYVESSTVGDKDLYRFTTLPEGLIPVGAMVVTNARKSGAGPKYIQTISKQDLVEYNDSDPIPLSLDYPTGSDNRPVITMHATAPDGTEWTRTKLNEMQFGFKVAETPVPQAFAGIATNCYVTSVIGTTIINSNRIFTGVATNCSVTSAIGITIINYNRIITGIATNCSVTSAAGIFINS